MKIGFRFAFATPKAIPVETTATVSKPGVLWSDPFLASGAFGFAIEVGADGKLELESYVAERAHQGQD